MITSLEHARDVLADIPGVVSCKIGIEKNLSPADYPMIRLVPSRLSPGRPYSARTIQTFIYFGAAVTESEGLESVYAALSAMELSIIEVLRTLQGRYIATVTDEDRLDTYKLMAIECELAEPDYPQIRCALYAASVTLALTTGAAAATLTPFDQSVQEVEPADWTPTIAQGSISRLLDGATTTTTKIVVRGAILGPVAGSVAVGVYANGTLVGNRTMVATTGPSATPVAFTVESTHTATIDTAYTIRAVAWADGSYVFSGLSFTAQAA
jgi:hypothetical protein